MSLRLWIQEQAGQEYTAAIAWYESQVPGLGPRFQAAIEAVLIDIVASPLRGSLAPGIPERLGIRRRLVADFPYAVFYLVHSDEIQVVAIGHGSRRPRYWIKRLR